MTTDDDPAGDELLALLEAGDLAGAIALLDARLAVSGEEARHALWLTRGRLALAAADSARAVDDLNRALDSARTSAERGAALLARGEARLEAGELDDAAGDLLDALSLLSGSIERAEAAHLLARIDLAAGDSPMAVERLSRVVTDLSGVPGAGDARAEAMLDLAQAFRSLGDASRARALLEDLLVWSGTRSDWLGRVHALLATTLAFEGRFDLAVSQYDQALANQPEPVDRARTLYNRAVAWRELHDPRAAADLRAALAENAGHDPWITFDALFLLGIVARESADLTASVNTLREAVAAAPNDDAQGRARLEIGVTLATTGLYGPAAAEFAAAIALCADALDRERAHRYRANARKEMGLPALALDDVTAALALTLDPDERARGAMTRAALLLELDRENEAYAALKDAPLDDVEDDRVRAQLTFQLGSLATRRGDIELALARLTEAEGLARAAGDPHFLGQVLTNRGVALDVARETQAAIACFREVTRLAPSPELVYQAWMNLGRVYADRVDPPAALEAFGLAATAADDRDARAMAFLSRGSAAMRWGRYVEADADFTRILVLQPSDPIATQARYYRGLTASLLGQLERARDDLTRTIEREQDRDNRAQALLDRGLVALSAGDYPAAERDLREASETFRRRAQRALALVHLAALFALQDRCDDAAAALSEASRIDSSGEASRMAQSDPRLDRCRAQPGFPALTSAPDAPDAKKPSPLSDEGQDS